MDKQMPAEEDMTEDTSPMPYGERREHRRIFRFDPTVSTGSLIQIGTVLVGFGLAWGTYQSDRTSTRMEIEQIKLNAAADKVLAKEAVNDMKQQMDKVQATLTSVDKAVTSIQAEIGARRQGR